MKKLPKKQKLHIFGWPSHLGGADTKVAHLLELLQYDFNITVVPNNSGQLKETYWTNYMDVRKIKYCAHEQLPDKIDSIALSICNGQFFKKNIHRQCIARGMRVIWSSEMMWMHEGEKEAIELEEIDKLLVVSDIQRKKINYGAITKIPIVETGNWIWEADFPFFERPADRFNIGRVSRADQSKYPENFPQFYDKITTGIPNCKKRVLGWSADLSKKFKWFKPDASWDLLEAGSEPVPYFLSSIDVWVYPLGHTFTESWGRSTVEAMLTGLVPIVDTGHHLDYLIPDNMGFKCYNRDDYEFRLRWLLEHPDDHRTLKHMNSEYARHIMNRETHLKIWKEALA